MSDRDQYPGFTEEAHPEVFNVEAMPPHPAGKKPGQQPEEVIRKFFDDGYVVLPDFFTKEELDPCREAVNRLVEELAQKLHRGGKIKDLYSDCGFFERLIKLEADFPGANIMLHKHGVLPPEFKAIWTNERLLNMVEQLIGPNIAGHPVWNLRTKTPQNTATTVPWHQDVAYLDNESYKVLQPAAWIPLLDANEENGCMEMVTKGHRTGKIAPHQGCWADTWYMELLDEEMEARLDVNVERDRRVCPVPYGGLLLLNNLIPHRSLPNRSKQIRWSMDLRWQRPDLPNGFYGLKDSILMRTAENPGMAVDWGSWGKEDRNAQQADAVKDTTQAVVDEFDTTIQGPWMKKWKIVNRNRHMAKLDETIDYSTWHQNKA